MTPQPLTRAEASQLTEALLNDSNRELLVQTLLVCAQTRVFTDVAQMLRSIAPHLGITLKP